MEKQKTVKRYYTPREAAGVFGYAEGTLANMRSQRVGCPYFKRNRKVLYDASQFEMWVRGNPVLTRDSIE